MYEQENNPYYMKSLNNSSKKLQSFSTINNINKSNTNESSDLIGKNIEKDNKTTEVQSLLEIPGVIGLDQYLKQQKSTLSWKNVKSEQKVLKKKHGKTSKKDEKNKKRANKKNNLSVLSSSDEGLHTFFN